MDGVLILRRSARFLLLSAIALASGCSKSEPAPPAAPATDQSAVSAAAFAPRQGWLAAYSAPGGVELTAWSPTGAFALDPGESVHPAVASSGLAASLSGVVAIEEPGRYRFGAEVEGGQCVVTLSGVASAFATLTPAENAAWTEWVTLPRGEIEVRYQFTRSSDAPARLRPLWEMERAGLAGFGNEPIPSTSVRAPRTATTRAANAAAVHRGRILLGELSCTGCHTAPESTTIARAAPDLSSVARRADAEWLAKWISNPQTLKPGCGMPDVIDDSPEAAADATAIVAFLASLAGSGGDDWPAPATEQAVIDAGRDIYQSVGCVACHSNLGDADAPIPHGDLRGKWNARELAAFVRSPGVAHPGGRMPSLLLTEEEADALATYLLSAWGAGSAVATDPSLADKGRAAFVARGCASCHATEGIAPVSSAPALKDVRTGEGCLSPSAPGTPRYGLSESDRSALVAAIDAMRTWTAAARAPADAAILRVEAMGCVNCHQWHGLGGVREKVRDHFEAHADVDLGDEGRFPPRLDGVGWKLTSQWMETVLTQGGRARPYMRARMPQFGKVHVGILPDELAKLDGVWPEQDRPEPVPTDELVQAGVRLVGATGLNCISCHTFSEAPPAGAPGPNIAQFAERLRYDWWDRYVHAPPRFKPGTRMPTFFAAGLSPQAAILEGDARRQSDAMWAYFSLGELFMPAPEGLASPGGLVVRVAASPTILRTFLKDVGARGIALGFPSGLHFAFDGANGRLAYAWTGEFLDASGAWANRGGTEVAGQGATVWRAPDGPVVAFGSKPDAWPREPEGWRFRGYRLDDAGVPTFLASVNAHDVSQTVHPYPRDGVLFSRVIEVEGLKPGETFWILPGGNVTAIQAEGGSAFADGSIVAVKSENESVRVTLEVAR